MIIKIRVVPNSSRQLIEKISLDQYKAHLKSPPENNKANIELINILAKELKVPAKSIKIKNPHSKNKIIEIN